MDELKSVDFVNEYLDAICLPPKIAGRCPYARQSLIGNIGNNKLSPYYCNHPLGRIMPSRSEVSCSQLDWKNKCKLNLKEKRGSQEVYLHLEGGAIQGWSVPPGVKVIVRDYDTDSVDEAVLADDGEGELCQTFELEGEG